MYKTRTYANIENNNLKGNHIIIDVRSPSEYIQETIPNSINIPILDDKERIIVGTAYKQESTDKAKKLGIEIVSKKLPYLYEEFYKLSKQYNNLILTCARGGFRSSSLVALLDSINFHVFKLDGGYKAYRHHILEELPNIINEINFVVLYGNTGSGKTNILKSLSENSADVLDLEGYANHRGSVLGGVGLGEQNSQKVFESLVYQTLKNRKNNTVFVEGEGKRIGRVYVPDFIYDRMLQGKFIKIEASMEDRVNNILHDYVHNTNEELIESLNYLRKHLGHAVIDDYITLITNNCHSEVIKDLIINYYDPMYEFRVREYANTFTNTNANDTALKIIEWNNSI